MEIATRHRKSFHGKARWRVRPAATEPKPGASREPSVGLEGHLKRA